MKVKINRSKIKESQKRNSKWIASDKSKANRQKTNSTGPAPSGKND